ncbi:MAG: Bax inhibitor-1/YccA family protein [Steroidobacteraceae bacterium]|jgi:uncharacterized YccA/Bax inhibitor family protein
MDYKSGNPGLNTNTFNSVARPLEAAERMTVQGTVNKAFLMLIVLLLTALWTWAQFFTHAGNPQAVTVPMIGGLIGGFVLSLIIIFKQKTAPYLALPYAALEGLALGGISAMFELRYPGIAIQAVGLTFGVLGAMLIAYTMRLINVTARFRSVIIGLTGAVALFYVVTMVLQLFHVSVPIMSVNNASPLSILFSLAVMAIAAMNLLLDFNIIETGVSQGAPRYMEWYCAFGLMVTLVWLYMEVLRFLGKMRSR